MCKNIMGKIKKLLDIDFVGGTKTEDVYPVTSTKAVFNANNTDLDALLSNIDSSISTINTTLDSLKTVPNRSEFNTVKSDVAKLDVAISSLNTEINNLEKALNSIDVSGTIPIDSSIFPSSLENIPVSISPEIFGCSIAPYFQKGYKDSVFADTIFNLPKECKHIILPFGDEADKLIYVGNNVFNYNSLGDNGGVPIPAKTLIFCDEEGEVLESLVFDGENQSISDVYSDNLITDIPSKCAYIVINCSIDEYPEVLLHSPLGLPLSQKYLPNYIIGLGETIKSLLS